MTRLLLAALATSLIAGCTASGGLTVGATKALTLACQVDGALQPIAVTAVAAAGTPGATAAAADSLFVHPSVVAACAALNGAIVAVPVAAPVPVAVPVPVGAVK